MIQTTGRVVALREGQAFVELAQTTACTSCSSKKSCGHSQDETAGKTQIVAMDAPLHAHVGDQVTVTMSSAGLHGGALLGYLLPSVTTIAGAVIFAPSGDNAAAGGLALGLAVGLALVRFISRMLPGLVSTHCSSSHSPSH